MLLAPKNQSAPFQCVVTLSHTELWQGESAQIVSNLQDDMLNGVDGDISITFKGLELKQSAHMGK